MKLLSAHVLSSLVLAFASLAPAAEPSWIWSEKDANVKAPAGNIYFRRGFDVDAPRSGTVEITVDNRYELFLNGHNVGSGAVWQTRTRYDLGPLLIPGRNVLAVMATNDGTDPAGLVAKVAIQQKDNKPAIEFVTDAEWKFTAKQFGNWARLEFDDRNWTSAVVLGEYGKLAPWGKAGEVKTPQAAVVTSKPRATEKGFFDFRDGDRVVFLGSAFIERMQKYNYLETMITAGLPDKNITFRNLGWSGDTVWGDARAVFGTRADGFKRLLSDVNLCNPTVIIVCYGENEAYEGESGIDGFRDGLNKLLDSLEATGARLLLLSPRQHESLGYPLPDQKEYNASLKLYRDVIAETAKAREHAFVDLYNSVPSGEIGAKVVSENGVHLTPAGEYLLARELLPQLGVPKADWNVAIDLKQNSLDAVGAQVTDLKVDASGVSFSAIWRGIDLPLPAPLNANRMLHLQGLTGAGYHLFIDGEPQQAPNAWNERFAVPLTLQRSVELQRKINEKNTLFFNRHRPQNETYLFLFRKHEQGNNAVEIPQFDPLIAEKEKEIAELRQPQPHRFEVKLAP
ncbi:GDSL-like Lipase/Acylhydrolase [Anatilimnocola aggregata]|uniref:GDSL-like Lipase/Acylhydrolase n=1 Tax=Anatilimnocola aggregata TaxID=2528021 RepID=A0A517Y5M4_9BACT|nr:GDSL-type esterase/lipase family protein [Anatilimnocola aggregata]QDU25432.1 GDSL-like Lipase/Acylhydrolase [Anatilimnocola aggregata]